MLLVGKVLSKLFRKKVGLWVWGAVGRQEALGLCCGEGCCVGIVIVIIMSVVIVVNVTIVVDRICPWSLNARRVLAGGAVGEVDVGEGIVSSGISGCGDVLA